MDVYSGREQTKAKHFVLKTYLQALAFKVLTFSDLAYVDGFSGPWETRTETFADSSFMIAIQVLKDAQQQLAIRGTRRKIRCFFCERDPEAFRKLRATVEPYHNPNSGFEVQTHGGSFTDAVREIQAFIGNSFALIFIDPTGWTGYDLKVLRPLLTPRLTEVIVNYMYDFINRGVSMSDAATVASFDPILGGPGWANRLDPDLAATDRGLAVEKLFRETLQLTGRFEFVVSTKIYRPTIDRPNFFLTYATKDKVGLSTFRETEYRALKQQASDRSVAKERKREEASGSVDMFAGMDAAVQSLRVDDFVAREKVSAAAFILLILEGGSRSFADVWAAVLQEFVLRITNVKDVCVTLARGGRIENTWGSGNRKPRDSDTIRLKPAS
ncbi:MAG TPA: three-Cys-motif partner protein TcmP [Steroidobacteraceae bacterium]|jgi:three-Cys-motif partner protein